MESDRDPDLCNRSDWIAIGRAARNRVQDLGSGVFVAWRSRLTHRRLALFRRLDVRARRKLPSLSRGTPKIRPSGLECFDLPLLGPADEEVFQDIVPVLDGERLFANLTMQ